MPQPRAALQPDSAFEEVPYPPPAAHAEVIPKRPRGDAVWIDGQWLWQGSAWAWDAGGWVVAPPGAAFSPWVTRRAPDGRLFFAAAKWHDRQGRELPPPPFVAQAGTAGSHGATAAAEKR